MRQSPPVRLACLVALSAVALLPACSDGTGPSGPPLPPALEQTPHGQIGNVRIAFERLGSLAGAIYWLDGGSGNWGGFTGLATDAALSPDGRRIAFRTLTDNATFWDVYVADVNGGGRQQLSSEALNSETAPTWTTDGAVVWGVMGAPIRFVRHVTGSAQPETIGSFEQPFSQPCPAYSPFDGRASVSPSGELLFVCQGQALYRMVPSGQPALLYQRDDEAALIRHADWSPSGDRVVFLSHRMAENSNEPGFVRIHMLDATGSTPTLVAERSIPAGSADFANGRRLTLCWAGSDRIVFAAPTGQFTAHIFVVPVAGGTPVQLTSAPGVADGPVSCSRTAF
jgi:dipeptidyl aminopeptidase/acylaminoacyl peptidase